MTKCKTNVNFLVYFCDISTQDLFPLGKADFFLWMSFLRFLLLSCCGGWCGHCCGHCIGHCHCCDSPAYDMIGISTEVSFCANLAMCQCQLDPYIKQMYATKYICSKPVSSTQYQPVHTFIPTDRPKDYFIASSGFSCKMQTLGGGNWNRETVNGIRGRNFSSGPSE